MGSLSMFATLQDWRDRHQHRLVIRAMSEQALADAKLCKNEADRALFNWKNDLQCNQPYWNGAEQMAANLANDIRANAPKVTT